MGRDNAPRGVGQTDRGQSVLDYTIGVSLFLVVVLGALVFVPTAFGVVDDDGAANGEDRLAADRVANYLTETGLSESDATIELQRHCVLAYFGDEAWCGLETGGGLNADSALASSQALNVTIEYDRDDDDELERLCWEERPDSMGTGQVVTVGHSDCDTPFTGGSNATANQNYQKATRLARFEGADVFVVVRVW